MAEGTYAELQRSDLDYATVLRKCSEGNAGNGSVRNDRRASCGGTVDDDDEDGDDDDDNDGGEDVAARPEARTVEGAETRCSGNVSSTVYRSYLSAGGTRFAIAVFVAVCIACQLLTSGGDLWISYW